MEYEPVIGLEIHVRINTKSKLFCRCSNDTFSAPPNSRVCPVCAGFPGMLPLLNGEAVKKGIKAALALECSIPAFSKFDRKSYFYPDLPKGFQISQYKEPISEKGSITITLKNGNQKIIGVTRLHLEDDAGKLTHSDGATLLDFNRSGCPLMEIVSGPDMNSVEEASTYAREIQKIVRAVDSSNADMEKGEMRFDINVSLRPQGRKEFGTKVEVKNLNSFRSLEKALIYEIQRQKEVLDNHGQLVQETRGWDDQKEITISQRSKEEAAEYRYFPEPDIPPMIFTREMIEALKKELPELPEAKSARYQKEFHLPLGVARQIAADPALAFYFEKANAVSGQPQKTANWVLSELMALLNEENFPVAKSPFSAEHLGMLVKLIEEGAISGKIAKEIFFELYKNNFNPETYIKEKGLKVMSDSKELETICQKVIDKNPESAEAFKAGKERALGALVGQVMAATKGTANPKLVNEIFKKLLAVNE